MKIFNNASISKKYKYSSLAIGNFDGIHLGHQKVFKKAKNFAKKNKSKFGILTFSPLPKMFFNKRLKNYRLTSENQKLIIFKKYAKVLIGSFVTVPFMRQEIILMKGIIDYTISQGVTRIPIETDVKFQRAFSASFDRLPIETPLFQRGALTKVVTLPLE